MRFPINFLPHWYSACTKLLSDSVARSLKLCTKDKLFAFVWYFLFIGKKAALFIDFKMYHLSSNYNWHFCHNNKARIFLSIDATKWAYWLCFQRHHIVITSHQASFNIVVFLRAVVRTVTTVRKQFPLNWNKLEKTEKHYFILCRLFGFVRCEILICTRLFLENHQSLHLM